MDLIVSRSGTINFFNGVTIWDDPVKQTQVRLLPKALQIIGLVAAGSDADEIAGSLGRDGHRNAADLIGAMLGAGILRPAAEASSDEQNFPAELATWGPGLAHFHFSGRTTADTVFADERTLDLELQKRCLDGDVPPYFPQLDGSRVDLDTHAEGQLPERCRVLLHLMQARRSRRVYAGRSPFPREAFRVLLDALHTPTYVAKDSSDRPTKVRRVIPSAGGLQAVDVGLVIRNVEGLDAGTYRFDRQARQLVLVGAGLDDRSWVGALGEQAWVSEASFAMVYFARTRLIRWKYERTRAYRSLFLEAGHQSYAAYLLAEALGVAHTFIGAVRDDALETALGLDPRHELVLGASVFGVRDSASDGASEDLTSFEWQMQPNHDIDVAR